MTVTAHVRASDGTEHDITTPSPVVSGSREFPYVTTAADKFGWGPPDGFDDFMSMPAQPNWWVYDGAGHGGNGIRTPRQVFIDTANSGVMSIIGTPDGASAGMGWGKGQHYGRWEVAMKTSAGSLNYHPVMLTWPDSNNWPPDGEIDFCEINDSASRQSVSCALHYGASNRVAKQLIQVDATKWHAWALEWTSTEINAYCDGVRFAHFTDPSQFPPAPHHLCLQLDNFGGDVSAGGRMDFAWVKRWNVR